MIVPMKKIAVIVRSVDAGRTVKDLRGLGVLHVEHQQQPQDKDITVLQEDYALVNAALDVFAKNEHIQGRNIFQEKINTDWHVVVRHLIDLEKRHEQLEMYAQKLQSTIAEWAKWGDFEPQKLEELSQKGIYVSLYQVQVKKLDAFPKEAIVKTIYTSGGIVSCAVFSRQKLGVPFKEVTPPKNSLSYMQKRISQDAQLMHAFKDEIYNMFHFYKDFLRIKGELGKELELQQAIKGMLKFGALTYIAGYAPADKVEILMQKARSNQWGIVVREPQEEDNVPTLIRNPRWVSLISPVLKFLEILPGYRELDISPLFLIFFSIFFGILIGDAGYGLVYFLLTFWMHKKFGKIHAVSKDFFLFYVLSLCAIIWGLLTGSFFGQEWLTKTGFEPLVPALNNTQNIQSLCFFIGALHLTLAHSWRAILKFPSLTALSDIGWVFVLWAAFFFAKLLILSQPLPPCGMWFFIIGVTLVMFFTNPQKNILKTIGEGLSTLALSLMNNFTDVVSYVRLFAVGLAGVAIADTFNNMAAGIGTGNIFAIIASCFIVITGHSLNLILGPMSVLVHGVRLNVLEFSGHANVTWSGFAYKPLK